MIYIPEKAILLLYYVVLCNNLIRKSLKIQLLYILKYGKIQNCIFSQVLISLLCTKSYIKQFSINVSISKNSPYYYSTKMPNECILHL